jgi:hypothetical protein
MMPAWAAVESAPTKAVEKNPELFSWLLGVAIFGALVLLKRQVDQSDANNKVQWDKINKHEEALRNHGEQIARIETRCEEREPSEERRRTPHG